MKLKPGHDKDNLKEMLAIDHGSISISFYTLLRKENWDGTGTWMKGQEHQY
jgi:hypothetical protein